MKLKQFLSLLQLLRKLKLPVKAFQALILIMVIFQQCSSSHGQIRCFGPVWKTKVFNIDNGYVYVNKASKHQIFINKTIDSNLFKISTPLHPKHRHEFHGTPLKVEERHAFYLFDPNTRRFLCWKTVNGSMTTMNYDQIHRKDHWNLCKFFDHIPNDERYSKTYVNLQLAGHPGTTMQFDKKGRNISHHRIKKCLRKSRNGGRHIKRCMGTNIYLLYYDNQHEDCCSEAYKTLCKGKTALMPELRDKCEMVREKSVKC